MLKILIVEDDSQLATTLKYLVEDNPRYRVVAIADDADNAVAAAEYHRPDLALVDLHLARGSTGFSVAVRLSDFEVPCLFVSGKAPSFPKVEGFTVAGDNWVSSKLELVRSLLPLAVSIFT